MVWLGGSRDHGIVDLGRLATHRLAMYPRVHLWNTLLWILLHSAHLQIVISGT